MQGYGEINYLTIDLETLPNGDVDFEQLKTKEELESLCPKSYSGKKRDDWIEKTFNEQSDRLNQEHRKKALNSLEGRIFCIAYKYNDEETKCVTYDPNEERMMEKFELALGNDIGDREMATICFVGHNVRSFDLRFLAHRAMKYKCVDLLRWLPMDKFDKRVLDTNDLFNLHTYGNYSKLDDIAKFFGLEGKMGMSGDKVYDYFLDNKYNEIHEYCVADVDLTRDIFKIINGWT